MMYLNIIDGNEVLNFNKLIDQVTFSIGNNIFTSDVYIDVKEEVRLIIKLIENEIEIQNNSGNVVEVLDRESNYNLLPKNSIYQGMVWLKFNDILVIITNYTLSRDILVNLEKYKNNFYTALEFSASDVEDLETSISEASVNSELDHDRSDYNSSNNMQKYSNSTITKMWMNVITLLKVLLLKFMSSRVMVWLKIQLKKYTNLISHDPKTKKAAYYIVIFVVLVILIAFFVFNNLFTSSSSIILPPDKNTASEINSVKLDFNNIKIANLDVYYQKNEIVVSGLLLESNITTKLSLIKAKHQNISFDLNLPFYKTVLNYVDIIKKQYNLICFVDKNYTTLTCYGAVDDDSFAELNDEIYSSYEYNEVLPLQLNLTKKSTIINNLNNLFSNAMFKNITYVLNKNTLYITGYIFNADIAEYASLKQNIKLTYPYINIKDDTQDINKLINLDVREIQFTNAGNVFIDENNNIYGIGSIYKSFTVVDIQRKFIALQRNGLMLYYPTSFISDFQEQDQSNNTTIIPLAASAVDKQNHLIVNDSANNKLISQTNNKTAILNEITQNQSPRSEITAHAFDDLISGLTSDIAYGRDQVKYSNTTQN